MGYQLELRHFRYFLAVAEELNFRKASEKLFISQPGLRRQIKQMEEILDTQLFIRNKRNVHLTPGGAYLRGEIEFILNHLEWTQKLETNQHTTADDNSWTSQVRFAFFGFSHFSGIAKWSIGSIMILVPKFSRYAIWIARLTCSSLCGSISSEKHLRMAAGDQFDLAGYSFIFSGTTFVEGPNFVADQGEFQVMKDGQEITRMYPQKRRYRRAGQMMTEAAIDSGLTRDLYVSMGEPLDEGRAWAIRIYHKPFVRWIWLGALFMSAGGLLAAGDRRYRSRQTARETAVGEVATI